MHRVTQGPRLAADEALGLAPSSDCDRGTFVLKGMGGLAAATLVVAAGLSAGTANAATSTWPGHLPGKTYIGLHGSTDLTGPTAVNRSYGQWGDDASEDRQIKADHANNLLPWVSFKPPADCGADLGCITDGSHDAEILAKAARYRTYAKPVITTFFHEPVGDVTAQAFNAAYLHIDRIFDAEGTGQVTFAPILNGYLWNDWYQGSKGAVEEWVSPELVATTPLFGADHYGQTHEIRRMFDYLVARGVASVGIAEFGRDHGAAEFEQTLALFDEYRSSLAVVAYFNSRIQTFGDCTSPLGCGDSELDDFRTYLQSTAHLGDTVEPPEPPAPDTGDYSGIGTARVMCDLGGTTIDESSGLAASRRFPGVLWTHNDSKATPDNRIVGVDVNNGCARVATIRVTGAVNRDWEDIAIRYTPSGNDVLYVANVGSAGGAKYIAKVAEPRSLGLTTQPATVYPLTYQGGQSYNAETVMVRPSDGRLFVATKESPSVNGLWRAPATLSTDRNVFTKVAGNLPGNIGSGDWDPTGGYYMLASVNAPAYVYVYDAATHTLVDTWSKPHGGESLTWRPNGAGIYFGHEGSSSDVYYARVYRQ